MSQQIQFIYTKCLFLLYKYIHRMFVKMKVFFKCCHMWGANSGIDNTEASKGNGKLARSVDEQ